MPMILILFAGLTVVYISLTFYARARERDRLEAEWDAGGIPMPRDAFIRKEMKEYGSALHRKLILGVYILPVCLVALIIYLVNFA